MFRSRSVRPHADNAETSVVRGEWASGAEGGGGLGAGFAQGLSASPGGTCTVSMAAMANWVGVGEILVDGLHRRGAVAGEQLIAIGGQLGSDEGVQVAAAAPTAMMITTTRTMLVTKPIDSRDGIECTGDGRVISMTTSAAAFPVWITHAAETLQGSVRHACRTGVVDQGEASRPKGGILDAGHESHRYRAGPVCGGAGCGGIVDMGAEWPSGGVCTACAARLLFAKGVLIACAVATSASFMSGKSC